MKPLLTPSLIRQLRLARNWTLEELAEATGLAVSTIWRYEQPLGRAEARTPSPKAQQKLAVALDFKDFSDVTCAPTARLVGDVQVGPGTEIEDFVVIDAGENRVKIGARCRIGSGAHIYGRLEQRDRPPLVGDVLIGDDVHLGERVLVHPGAMVAEGAVVPPGCVVEGTKHG